VGFIWLKTGIILNSQNPVLNNESVTRIGLAIRVSRKGERSPLLRKTYIERRGGMKWWGEIQKMIPLANSLSLTQVT